MTYTGNRAPTGAGERAATANDLKLLRLAIVEVEPAGFEQFTILCDEKGGLSDKTKYQLGETGSALFRLPLGCSIEQDYSVDPGVTIKVQGSLSGFSEADISAAALLPSWLLPPERSRHDRRKIASEQPANDNEFDNDWNDLPPPDDDGEPEIQAPSFTDEALALQFATDYRDELRYVAAWGRWMVFDGTRWRYDEKLIAYDRARQICRKAAAECNELRQQKLLATARTVNAVITLARADQRIAATVEQWDADPWLLNTPDGVIDLRTGKMRPHDPRDYMTKITGISPDASCPTALWQQFLSRIMGGDAALVTFLQRVSGYALTGLTREHVLFFLYGTGANGKSTFLAALISCIGDYHRTAAIETFTDSANDRHPTEIAGLRGARLVTSVETEEGRRWAESRIKTLTGGDRVSARFMRQDFFEFTPQFKLLIAGNHKPGLRTVDEAIRRRLHLVPFSVTIPVEERDLELINKLKTELPGILAWMIQGCLDWQKQGLSPPASVSDATAAYLDAEDSIAAWIEECCDRDPSAWECQRRSKNASAGRSKNTSAMLAIRPPNWGLFLRH
ncbi:MAG: phage/plasmid primase, P4 family [Xanthobacteraceae bacterium]